MGTIKLISGEFCSRCHMIEPLLYKYAEANGIEFIHKDVNEATTEEIEGATSLPVVWFDDKQMDYDGVLATISE